MLSEQDVRRLYRMFDAPVVAFDCGAQCAPNNGGVPFCCDDGHAIPVLYTNEFNWVRKESDLWRGFRPRDAHERSLLGTIGDDARFARCKHTACERDYRSFSCRSFPFFPYVTREGDFIGMSYYWGFRDRCWIHNLVDRVEPAFVKSFFAAWDLVFEKEPDERDAYREWSATCRRVHGRWKRSFYVIDRDGEVMVRRPGEEFLIPARMLPAKERPEGEGPMRAIEV